MRYLFLVAIGMFLSGCTVDRLHFGPTREEVISMDAVKEALQQRDAAMLSLLQRVQQLEAKKNE